MNVNFLISSGKKIQHIRRLFFIRSFLSHLKLKTNIIRNEQNPNRSTYQVTNLTNRLKQGSQTQIALRAK